MIQSIAGSAGQATSESRIHPSRAARCLQALLLGLVLLSSLGAPSRVGAQDDAPAAGDSATKPAQAAAPCSAPEYRQMDFWLGSWDVTNRTLEAPGPHSRNEITSAEGGCVVVERYTAGRGYTGRSLSFWDARREVWHQTWIDNRGQALYLEGRFEDGRMVLEGRAANGNLNRITWGPLPEHGEQDAVRQLWEVSQDGGETWNVGFDGLYERRPR